MKLKKEKDFVLHSKITGPKWYLRPIAEIICFFMLDVFGKKTKINKINCENVKEPCVIFSNHASMIDFPNLWRAAKPHKSIWVTSIEEFIGREWLMRGIGCVPKRKYTKDTVLIRNIASAAKLFNVVIYPEARFSLCGINEEVGDALGKFAKLCKAPVVVFNQRGNFIHSPQWHKKPELYKLPCEADFICVATKEEVKTLSAEELQARIEKAFVYDDYLWQYENKIKNTYKDRAVNLHKILYKCPCCMEEQTTFTYENKLGCSACQSLWEMDEYGRLHIVSKKDDLLFDEELSHIPNWYRWERACVKESVRNKTYKFSDCVRVEKLINGKVGFRNLGVVQMEQTNEGIKLYGKLDNGEDFEFFKPATSTTSIHIEYNFKKRGDAIDIANLDETYFVFPLQNKNILTKIHFATEEIFKLATEEQSIDLFKE